MSPDSNIAPAKDVLPATMFGTLAIPKRKTGNSQNCYRVYSDDTNFIIVEGNNAQEAIEKSNIKSPTRVIRDNIFLNVLINLPTVDNAASAAAQPASEPTTQPVAEAIATPPPAQEAAKPLSNDDIDKLLQG